MFCKHFIKIFWECRDLMGASRVGGCEVRGSTQYIPHKNMKSATAFCPDRLCFSDSASCYLSLWNTVAVHIFILNTLCTSRIHFVVREAWQNYFLIQKLSLWESFWSYMFIYGSYFTSYFITFGLHMPRGMLLRAGRRRMYS